MNLGHLIVDFFLDSGNLICRSTDISMYFRESLGVRDIESQLYIGSYLEMRCKKSKNKQFSLHF